MHMLTVTWFLTKSPRANIREMTLSSKNGAEKTGYTYAGEILYHSHWKESTQNGSNT
jgi:hypothetical protein